VRVSWIRETGLTDERIQTTVEKHRTQRLFLADGGVVVWTHILLGCHCPGICADLCS
jgi:hypothetical protein